MKVVTVEKMVNSIIFDLALLIRCKISNEPLARITMIAAL